MSVGDATRRQRQLGALPTGTVRLRDFDAGVVETLKARVITSATGQGNYFLTELSGQPVSSYNMPLVPPGQPGIPVTFAYPEDVYERWLKPCIVVSRDDIAPAMQRYHPGALQYNAPVMTSRSVAVPGRGFGYAESESLAQAVPMDITYSINIITIGSRNLANAMLDHVLRIYPPYAAIYVRDSLDDQRTYSAWNDGVSVLDELADVSERTIGFAVTLRVEAELDLSEPVRSRTALQRPSLDLQRK